LNARWLSRLEGTQRHATTNAHNAVVQPLAGMRATNIKRYQFVPCLAVTVNAAALQALANHPRVSGISEDLPSPLALAESSGLRPSVRFRVVNR
jgi:hypothetical protein